MTKRYLAIAALGLIISLPAAQLIGSAIIEVLPVVTLEITAVRFLSGFIVATIVYQTLLYLLKEHLVKITIDQTTHSDEAQLLEGTQCIYRGKGPLRCPACRAEMISEQWHVCTLSQNDNQLLE